MKQQLIKICHEMLLNSERIHVLSNIIREKDNTPPEIYVPLHFINETAKNLQEQSSEIETILLKQT